MELFDINNLKTKYRPMAHSTKDYATVRFNREAYFSFKSVNTGKLLEYFYFIIMFYF